MAEIYGLDVSAANNNSAPPDGFPENMQYSQVNNAAREQMAVLARYIQAMGAVTTTGTGNAYILTITQAITALANGMMFIFKADKTNTGAITLQINALGSAAVKSTRGAALAASDIVSGGLYLVQYDGTNFRLLSGEDAASVKTKYEANADTNEFSDAEQTKLSNLPGSIRLIRAASDEDRVSTVSSTDDAELVLTSVPIGNYTLEAFIHWNLLTNAGQGFRMGFRAVTGAMTGVWTASGETQFLSVLADTMSKFSTTLAGDASFAPTGATLLNMGVRIVGTLNVTTAGNFAFRFSQAVSDANLTRRKAGSWLRLTQF